MTEQPILTSYIPPSSSILTSPPPQPPSSLLTSPPPSTPISLPAPVVIAPPPAPLSTTGVPPSSSPGSSYPPPTPSLASFPAPSSMTAVVPYGSTSHPAPFSTSLPPPSLSAPSTGMTTTPPSPTQQGTMNFRNVDVTRMLCSSPIEGKGESNGKPFTFTNTNIFYDVSPPGSTKPKAENMTYEGPCVLFRGGISVYSGGEGKGTTKSLGMAPNMLVPEQAEFVALEEKIYSKLGEFVFTHRLKMNKPYYDNNSPASRETFKPHVFYPIDVDTKMPIPGRDPSITYKLVGDGKKDGSTKFYKIKYVMDPKTQRYLMDPKTQKIDEKTGLIDPNSGTPEVDPKTGKPIIDPESGVPMIDPKTKKPMFTLELIDWLKLYSVDIYGIPVIHLERIFVGAAGVFPARKILSVIVTDIKPKGVKVDQSETALRLAEQYMSSGSGTASLDQMLKTLQSERAGVSVESFIKKSKQQIEEEKKRGGGKGGSGSGGKGGDETPSDMTPRDSRDSRDSRDHRRGDRGYRKDDRGRDGRWDDDTPRDGRSDRSGDRGAYYSSGDGRGDRSGGGGGGGHPSHYGGGYGGGGGGGGGYHDPRMAPPVQQHHGYSPDAPPPPPSGGMMVVGGSTGSVGGGGGGYPSQPSGIPTLQPAPVMTPFTPAPTRTTMPSIPFIPSSGPAMSLSDMTSGAPALPGYPGGTVQYSTTGMHGTR